MSLFVIADLHLSFSAQKPMEVFGSRWTDHAAKVERLWRERIAPTDTVVLPGDLSWAIDLEGALPDLQWLSALPGKKWLCKGNHDYWWSTVSKMELFLKTHDLQDISFLHNRAELSEGVALCGARGWFQDERYAPKETDYGKIIAREVGRLERSLQDGKKRSEAAQIPFVPIVFLHFPVVFGTYACRELIDVMHRYGVTDCYYGHIHGSYDVSPTVEFEGIRFHLIAADYLQFCPHKIEL